MTRPLLVLLSLLPLACAHAPAAAPFPSVAEAVPAPDGQGTVLRVSPDGTGDFRSVAAADAIRRRAPGK